MIDFATHSAIPTSNLGARRRLISQRTPSILQGCRQPRIGRLMPLHSTTESQHAAATTASGSCRTAGPSLGASSQNQGVAGAGASLASLLSALLWPWAGRRRCPDCDKKTSSKLISAGSRVTTIDGRSASRSGSIVPVTVHCRQKDRRAAATSPVVRSASAEKHTAPILPCHSPSSRRAGRLQS